MDDTLPCKDQVASLGNFQGGNMMNNNFHNDDILAEARSMKTFFQYLTLLFTDGVTNKSRRMLREEWTPLVRAE